MVGKDIINVGGGDGHEAEFLIKNGAQSVTLVDIAPGQLKNAQIRKKKRGLSNLECTRGDAENLAFGDKSFDLGYVYCALHHFPDYVKSINEVCRVSKEVVFVDIMNPILTRTLTQFGFCTKEWCGIVPNRLNEKLVKEALAKQGYASTITYFFVAPLYTYNRFVTNCLIAFFKLTNWAINRSRELGLVCGNIAIIRGVRC